MKSKWVIFSDVDGTIYPFPDKTLSEVNLNKLKEIKEKNIPFVLNTGNPPYKKIQKLADITNGRYIVCSNGAIVYDNLEKKPIYVELMPLDEVKKIWDISNKTKTALYYFGTNEYYLKDMNKKWTKFIETFSEYYNYITHGKIVDDIHKIEVYGEPEEIERFYNESLKHEINLDIINLKSHIEITKRGISKATGLKWLCDNIFETSVENVMAIGDSGNDISMLKIAGYSYAMDNADQATKAAAKFYTSDVKQNGLAEAIDDYLYRSDFELKKLISQKGKK
ncbi:HAD family hydrolase [Mycoplasmopsis cricetuli]|uniref:HAD family hydrolase n=1 Tax=Mycoplasmopsis cricetuli TaxID=171283 RepID=UPI0012EBCFDE|nr:HAD family hydrolase [Mycoplasmopsis cricetuli]